MEQFQNIKVTRGIHFNQSLMKNKNFRNPHIYSSLVDLVALNEIGTNFDKKEFFDFEGYGPECYAAGLGKFRKKKNVSATCSLFAVRMILRHHKYRSILHAI